MIQFRKSQIYPPPFLAEKIKNSQQKMPLRISYSQPEKLYSNMKKELIIPSLGIVAAVFFSACSKNEVVSIADAPQKISLSPLTGKLSTRALLDGATYNADFPSFGTFAYYLPEGKNWDAYYNDATLYIPKSEVKYQEDADNKNHNWTTATPYYWPKTGGLTFFAYSPYYYQESTGVELPVFELKDGLYIGNPAGTIEELYDVDAHQETDILVAEIQKGCSGNTTNGRYSGVPIIFHHKLSQIIGMDFSTDKDYANGHDGTSGNEYSAGDKVFRLLKVELKNLSVKGFYGYHTGDEQADAWSASSDNKAMKSYTWYSAATEDTADKFGNTALNLTFNNKNAENKHSYLLIMPQFLDKTNNKPSTEPYLDIQYQVLTYTDGTNHSTETVDKKVTLHELHAADRIEMNKKIRYTFRISLEDQRIYWAPSIVKWDDVDDREMQF